MAGAPPKSRPTRPLAIGRPFRRRDADESVSRQSSGAEGRSAGRAGWGAMRSGGLAMAEDLKRKERRTIRCAALLGSLLQPLPTPLRSIGFAAPLVAAAHSPLSWDSCTLLAAIHLRVSSPFVAARPHRHRPLAAAAAAPLLRVPFRWRCCLRRCPFALFGAMAMSQATAKATRAVARRFIPLVHARGLAIAAQKVATAAPAAALSTRAAALARPVASRAVDTQQPSFESEDRRTAEGG